MNKSTDQNLLHYKTHDVGPSASTRASFNDGNPRQLEGRSVHRVREKDLRIETTRSSQATLNCQEVPRDLMVHPEFSCMQQPTGSTSRARVFRET